VPGVRVLICDDEPSIRLLYRTAFEQEGAEVVEAVDGDHCLEVAEAEAPDLVILDLFMPPGRDGLSALPELRRRRPEARVFVVSAHGSSETFHQCRSRGATACFDKLSFLGRIPRLIARYNGAA
jgi:CheY-like chemotaxis protein